MKFKAPDGEPVMIGLTSGHTLVITPEGTETESRFRKEAIAKRCVPCGVGDVEGAEPKGEPTKADLILSAVEKLIDEGTEADFDQSGKPKLAKVSAIAGFTVKKGELDTAWTKLQDSLKDESGDGEGKE
ncbi:MAG: hypothetical protein ACREVL_00895 [Solimonas sp.]